MLFGQMTGTFRSFSLQCFSTKCQSAKCYSARLHGTFKSFFRYCVCRQNVHRPNVIRPNYMENLSCFYWYSVFWQNVSRQNAIWPNYMKHSSLFFESVFWQNVSRQMLFGQMLFGQTSWNRQIMVTVTNYCLNLFWHPIHFLINFQRGVYTRDHCCVGENAVANLVPALAPRTAQEQYVNFKDSLSATPRANVITLG